MKVAAASLAEYLSVYKMPAVRLPEHLEGGDEKAVAEWNKASSELVQLSKQNQEKLSEIAQALLTQVMRSEDAASAVLSALFARQHTPTPEEVERARLRRERGNPPGKPDDPLGDQISWEQLLARYDGAAPLWIISKDNDFSSKVLKHRYFNAFLWNELADRLGRPPEVFVYDSLAEGLSHYSAHRQAPVAHLPPEEELKEIAQVEARMQPPRDPVGEEVGPGGCYKCGHRGSLHGPVPRPSVYGGWSYQWMCPGCRQWVDFGEPYDE